MRDGPTELKDELSRLLLEGIFSCDALKVGGASPDIRCSVLRMRTSNPESVVDDSLSITVVGASAAKAGMVIE
ncbi:hypothetical protein GCM10007359_19340 [Rothia aerolata]|uniref:Uncharacterized protein n=1 Tax=Rothia aerolata TaxID=1812262 RepID=A0A917IVH3_9MICC|nr:hypothetical protein GCM10007359_19340 [Rothia aerolata]